MERRGARWNGEGVEGMHRLEGRKGKVLSVLSCPSPCRSVPFRAVPSLSMPSRPSPPRPVPLRPVPSFSAMSRPSKGHPIQSLSVLSHRSLSCPVPLHFVPLRAVPSLSTPSSPSPSRSVPLTHAFTIFLPILRLRDFCKKVARCFHESLDLVAQATPAKRVLNSVQHICRHIWQQITS